VIKVAPPLQWFQSLESIEIELKFAYRHDVSGCAAVSDEVFTITDTHFSVSAKCAETHDNPFLYVLEFPFWADVKSDSVKI